ncbi:gamma-aminobutyric acid type B receptor subunit 2-like isoform X2 [Corticium candelabrum]|uniref:gamma-aminobutyric acid type B receptor subunit 2-like isoform X2 n=1 Tax=Corticium candelabrum TaxID=121492 RepID=UPI002E26F486|nr:gamma-aminobutyric acid type B receptor subunit 2-like isoform X2 [Corticium candelabrum]
MVSCSVDDMKKAVDGHFTLDFIKFRQDRDTMTEIGKTVQEVYMAFQEKGMSLENRSFDQYQAYGYDAVLFIALILDKLNKSTSSNHSPFSLEELPNEVAGEGVTGKLVLSNRTIMTQRNVEIRYVQTKDGEVSTVVYYYNGTENLTEIFQPNWTTEDGKRPLDVPRNETKYFHKGYYIFPATVAVIGVFGAVGMLVFNEYNRDKRIIKLSSPRLNNLIAVGAITIYVAVIFGGLDGQFFPITTNTLFCCYMYVSLLVFGFTLCFGSMFAKTWRVNVVMKRSRMGRTNFKLTDQVLFAIVGVFILVDALLLGLWFGINPFHVTKSIAESEGISNEQHIYVRCSSEHSSRWAYIILAYKAIVLAFGVLMAWETRKVQIVSLNDSRYITMSVYNTVVLCILAFAFHFIPTQHVQYLLVSMIIIIIVTVVLCLVFVPKEILMLDMVVILLTQKGKVVLNTPLLKSQKSKTLNIRTSNRSRSSGGFSKRRTSVMKQ